MNNLIAGIIAIAIAVSCRDDASVFDESDRELLFTSCIGSGSEATRAATNPEDTVARCREILPLQAADSAAAAAAEPLYLHVYREPQNEAPATRAAEVTDMSVYGSFGVFAYAYTGSWDGSATPSYIYNTEVTEQGGIWHPLQRYYWPGPGMQIRFFAYAPYNATGVTLPAKTTPGVPSLTYVVPTGVANQRDLLVSWSDELPGFSTTPASLNFNHALTAVQFETGANMRAGSIKKITLKGVYGKGICTMGDSGPTWDNLSSVTDFTQTLDFSASGAADETILGSDAVFMMIPQTLPAGANIEIIFDDDATGTQQTLTAQIEASEWPVGERVVYRISTTSIESVPTLTVTPPDEFPAQGGSGKYTVVSYSTVTSSGGSSVIIPESWTAQFSTDGGRSWTDQQPDWLTVFTASAAGSTDTKGIAYTIQAATQLPSENNNPYATPLVKAESINITSGYTPYNLSNSQGGPDVQRTANCYVINAPGTYSLPLVYGNAIDWTKNPTDGNNTSAYTAPDSGSKILATFVNHQRGITSPYIYENAGCENPQEAILLWQDEKDLVTNVALSDDKHSLTFDVDKATICQGNAVVAIRNASKQVMWSWHIWVTGYSLDETVTVTNHSGTQYTFMPINLGWCQVVSYDCRSIQVRLTQSRTGISEVFTINQGAETYSKPYGTAPYYQWGRKDPILRSSNYFSNTNKACYSDTGYAYTTVKGTTAITSMIINPHKFVSIVSGNWCKTDYWNFWNSSATISSPQNDPTVKTIYDPSPVGFCIPPGDAFTGFTKTGAESSDSGDFNVDGTFDYGWTMYCNPNNPGDGTIYFPATGARKSDGGGLTEVGTVGYYATSKINDFETSYGIKFTSTSIDPQSTPSRGRGYNVRPIREQ